MSDSGEADRPRDPVFTIAQHGMIRDALHHVEECAERTARRYRGLVEREDLKSVGLIELHACVLEIPAETSCDFEEFAKRRIRSAMLRSVRAETFHRRVQIAAERAGLHYAAHFNDKFSMFEETDDSLKKRMARFARGLTDAVFLAGVEAAQQGDAEHEAVARAWYADAFEALRVAMKKVPDREREVLVLLYVQLLTLNQAAIALCLPYSTTCARHTRALGRLRRSMEDQGVHRPPELGTSSNVVSIFDAARTTPRKPSR